MKTNIIILAVAILALSNTAQAQFTNQATRSTPTFSQETVRTSSNALKCEQNIHDWLGYTEKKSKGLVASTATSFATPVLDSTFRIRRTDLAPSIKLIGIN